MGGSQDHSFAQTSGLGLMAFPPPTRLVKQLIIVHIDYNWGNQGTKDVKPKSMGDASTQYI